jgi:hypothetical protein
MLPRLTSLAAALALAGLSASAQTLSTGPSTTTTPYVQGVLTGVDVTSILTTGDAVNGYRLAGIPDGLGAYDNGDGTFTVLMNHEIASGLGVTRAHGAAGAFVSQWVVRKSDLAVISGGDLIQRVYSWNAGTQSTGGLVTGSALSFQRFCSADLAPVSAYSYTQDGVSYGTSNRIFLNGEEVGTSANSRALAHIATGSDAGSSYVLGKFNTYSNGSSFAGAATTYASYENLLANPLSQLKTIVIGNNDGGTGVQNGALAVYVGTKTTTGSDIERAGLTNGTLKFVNVAGSATEIVNTGTRATNITSGTAFTLGTSSATSFSRPEDGAWTADGKHYYFVTTDQLDRTELTGQTQKGATRLWRLNFSDIGNPDAGGTIDLVIDGSSFADGAGKPNMFDNISVNSDGTVTLLEDTGNAPHNGKMWQYDPATGSIKIIARSDALRFGDVVNGASVGGTLTQDEETSGVIDVTDILGRNDGKKYELFVMQNHAAATGPNAAELVEGGQLLLLSIAAVPEPATPALMLGGLGLVAAGAARRRRAQG